MFQVLKDVVPAMKQFSLYFKDVDVSKFECVTIPFATNVYRLRAYEREQLADILCNGSLKLTIGAEKLPQFWLREKRLSSLTGKVIKVLLPFVTKHLCETRFSVVPVNKIKH
jgi:hypothetical protein